MEETSIYGILYETYRFSNINQYLSEWDLSPVEGKGLYVSGHTNYGHVQIKMYKSSDNNSKMVWNLSEYQLPNDYNAKSGIEIALRFFISYFEGIRGEIIPLIFEINDGSYHSVDSKGRNYTNATIYAIVDCFVKNAIAFRDHRLIRKNI
jgi:hypothetical protein